MNLSQILKLFANFLLQLFCSYKFYSYNSIWKHSSHCFPRFVETYYSTKMNINYESWMKNETLQLSDMTYKITIDICLRQNVAEKLVGTALSETMRVDTVFCDRQSNKRELGLVIVADDDALLLLQAIALWHVAQHHECSTTNFRQLIQ